MFTGLIQDVGTVRSVRPAGGSVELRLQTTLVGQLGLGDSLAVNGVCLTVTAAEGDVAVATAIPETLDLTNLGRLSPGDRVNLEPALRAQDRLGGHIVQGHVDGQGTLARRRQRGLSLELTVAAAADLLRYVVHKGSITIDGVSLTVAALEADAFCVALVPHTRGATTLEQLEPGARVNLEADILAKYVERMLQQRAPVATESQGGITEQWLRGKGLR